MDERLYRDLAGKIGWREAFQQWDRDRRTKAGQNQALLNACGAIVTAALNSAVQASLHGQSLAHVMAVSLARKLREREMDGWATYWEDRYRGSLKRCGQLLKRALDAERVVDAIRKDHKWSDGTCSNCGHVLGAICEPHTWAALRDYDRGNHR